ncbi:helix-turn-helix domain-containing protein [Ekhidna sp.]
MYIEEIVIEEDISIVEEILLIDSLNVPSKQILVPDNTAEIFIPVSGNLSFKALGSARSILMREGIGYFLMPRRRGTEITIAKDSEYLLVKINPMYAYGISRGLKEIFNGVFELGLNQSTLQAINRASRMQSIHQMEEILIKCFASKNSFFDHNITILESIGKIRNSYGTISVKEIYSSLNVSKSKLEQHFNREIGLTPKEYCKIEKINHFIRTYRDSCDQSLTEITYLCGYYDQSHLIKDFKYFLDTSPKRFFMQKGSLFR